MYGKKILNKLSPYKQGMQISEVAEKYQLDKIVKLASNENPYGFSPKVTETLERMAKEFQLYPDGYAAGIRTALADKLGVAPDQLVFGSGSDEVITFICRAFLEAGTNTVMATPTFPQYRHHALIEGATIKEIPTIDGHHHLDGMLHAIDKQTKVVWLCTPDNPTGSVIQQASLDAFMEKCPSDVIVVLDEAYFEYANETSQLHLHKNLKKYQNLIVLRTFSKIYGLAGLRVGYGISNETIATKLNIVRGPFNTTSISQLIMTQALEDRDFIQMSKENNEKVRTDFQQFLDTIHWHYYPSQTNFLLVKTPVDADVATQYLLEKGFIVRSGNALGYPKTIRITIGTKEDMQILQEIIMKFDQEIRDGVVE